MFKNNWITKYLMAGLSFSWIPFLDTKNNDTHISKNNILQTGPNTRLGAVNAGLMSVRYRPSIAGRVNRDPITHASIGISKHKSNVNS